MNQDPPQPEAAHAKTAPSPDGPCFAVTGATGFVGRAVVKALSGAGLQVHALTRRSPPDHDASAPGIRWHVIGDYTDSRSLERLLLEHRISGIVHLADNSDRNANRDAGHAIAMTQALSQALEKAHGAAAPAFGHPARLILASSIYARLAPETGEYGFAKRQSEATALGAQDLQTVILRLPPVYGPGGRGGFAMLAGLVRRGLPLPFGRANAPRAYLSRRNLADLILHLVNVDDVTWDRITGQIFEPSDGHPVSTADLIRHMAITMNRTPRLWPAPLSLLRVIGRLTGKADTIAGALDPLATEGPSLAEATGWHPTETIPDALAFLSKP